MSDWPTDRFDSLYLTPSKNGLTAPSRVRGSGVQLINMRELFRYDRIADPEMELAPLPERNAAEWLVQRGDLLFARQSLKLEGAGKCSIVLAADGERTFESHLIRVRLNRDVADPDYYYYYFRSAHGRTRIRSIVEQVAAAGIRSSDLAALQVPVPPLPEQVRISSTLRALDEKIDSNARAKRLAEELCHTYFAQLFDVSLDPAGTAVSSLVHVNPKRVLRKDAEATYVGMSALPENSANILNWEHRPPKSGQRFANGDVLMARITPCLENGKTAVVDMLDHGEVGSGSTEYIVLAPKGEIGTPWVYCLARSNDLRSYAIRSMTGTSGRQRFQASSLNMYKIATPPAESLRKFDEFAAPLFARMTQLRDENRILVDLRDALIARHLSGRMTPDERSTSMEEVA